MSYMDDGSVKHSRLSAATMGTETLVFGRDAVLEREKINNEARNTFAVMDLRYQDMVDDLIELDNAFELGLLNGNREEFEKRIQNVRIIKTPPKRPQELPRIELTVDDGVSEIHADDKLEELETVEKQPETETTVRESSEELLDIVTQEQTDDVERNESQEEIVGVNITKSKTDDSIELTPTPEFGGNLKTP